jgi:hypothetical protein
VRESLDGQQFPLQVLLVKMNAYLVLQGSLKSVSFQQVSAARLLELLGEHMLGLLQATVLFSLLHA